MKSLKRMLIGSLGLTALLALAVPAMATDPSWFDDAVRFKGRILDGPLAHHIVKGECRYSSQGDVELQKGPCTLNILKLTKGGEKMVFKMRDPRARLAIVGNQQQLETTMGIPFSGLGKGNNKSTAFKLTLTADRKLGFGKLFSDSSEIIASSITLLGTSVSQGGTADNPECLLWDDLCGTTLRC